jgi:Fic family protein
MFQPKYQITDQLLANIKRISQIINDLNNKRFPNIVLLELERTAREISSFASTSIEGNPLPLTEVKKILKSAPSNLRNSEREVLNYNKSLQKLNKRLEQGKVRLSLDFILNIQKQVTEGLLPNY